MKEVNEINPKIYLKVDDKKDLYRQYLRLLSGIVDPSNSLTAKELEIMTYILHSPVHHCLFRGSGKKKLLSYFNNSINTIRGYRRMLIEKGWLTNESMPNSELVKLQKIIQQKDISKINLTISIRNTE